MKIHGSAFKYGDDINTDLIIPGRFLHIYDPHELASHAMADLDPGFHKIFRKGDIIVAGKNFGCGSSREQAAICLKYAGVGAIIAKSFARIFYRNAINQGIPIVQAETDTINQSEELEIDLEQGTIVKITTGDSITSSKLPDFLLQLIKDGGLIEHYHKSISGDGDKQITVSRSKRF